MSQDYIETRIRAALKQHNGNAYNARKQVMAWTFEDTKLLQAITKTHLSGIVAYQIERVVSAIEAEEKGAPTAKQPANNDAVATPPKKQAPTPSKTKKEDAFGMQLLKAVAGSNEVFGFDSGRPARRPQASKRHSDILRHIAVDVPKD